MQILLHGAVLFCDNTHLPLPTRTRKYFVLQNNRFSFKTMKELNQRPIR